jgi:hypothetical protein
MDPARGAAPAIIFGIAFIALGLVPGTLVRLKNEIRRFGDSLSQSPPTHSHQSAPNEERVPGQIWWAVGGLALLALGLHALISK